MEISDPVSRLTWGMKQLLFFGGILAFTCCDGGGDKQDRASAEASHVEHRTEGRSQTKDGESSKKLSHESIRRPAKLVTPRVPMVTVAPGIDEFADLDDESLNKLSASLQEREDWDLALLALERQLEREEKQQRHDLALLLNSITEVKQMASIWNPDATVCKEFEMTLQVRIAENADMLSADAVKLLLEEKIHLASGGQLRPKLQVKIARSESDDNYLVISKIGGGSVDLSLMIEPSKHALDSAVAVLLLRHLGKNREAELGLLNGLTRREWLEFVN